MAKKSASATKAAAAKQRTAVGTEEEVDVEIAAEESAAWINKVPLDLKNGKGSMDLLPGKHALTFEVRGAPGTVWSVKITAPKEAKSEDGDNFDDTGFDAGRIKFTVGD